MSEPRTEVRRPPDQWFKEHLDDSFMENVREARENGYELVCVECGVGIYDGDTDIHVRGCSKYVEFRP